MCSQCLGSLRDGGLVRRFCLIYRCFEPLQLSQSSTISDSVYDWCEEGGPSALRAGRGGGVCERAATAVCERAAATACRQPLGLS